MNDYYGMNLASYESNSLAHYGVLGMKWGVRRYQNEDGTRTALGKKHEGSKYSSRVRRYETLAGRKTQTKIDKFYKQEEKYNKSRDNLSDIKRAYKEGNATKRDVARAKGDLNASKADLKKSYKDIKKGARYDKGREAYANGETIVSNNMKARWTNLAISAVAAVAADWARQSNSKLILDNGTSIDLDTIIYSTALVSELGVSAYTSEKNKNLRAYYSSGSGN